MQRKQTQIHLQKDISLRWIEKLWMIIDFGQLFALLWVASQPWPWPYLWVQWTRWAVWFNLDYFSTTRDGALNGQTGNIGISRWGQMDHYLYYALSFSVLVAIISIPLAVRRYLTYYYAAVAQTASLFLLQLIYLPALLAFGRLFYCEDGFLGADPSVICMSNEHIIYSSVSAILISPLIFALPWIMFQSIDEACVYNFRHDHEKRLQAWEIMYSLNLDDFWLTGQLWLLSSFKRNGCYNRLYILLLKFMLVAIFIFVRGSLSNQASIYFFVTSLFTLISIRYRSYRVFSSNIIMVVLCSCLLCATATATLNAYGVRNAAMVASRESFFLWALFSFSALIIVITSCVSALSSSDRWPTNATISRINSSSTVCMVSKWISGIKESEAVLLNYLDGVAEVQDMKELNFTIRMLRSYWLSARSYGSLFELLLCETLERLLLFHSRLATVSLRNNCDFLDESLGDAEHSLLKRERDTILMSRRKRRMLTKMTAMRSFLGTRVLDDAFNFAPVGNLGSNQRAIMTSKTEALRTQSSDWGLELDKTETLLQQIPSMIKATEKILQQHVNDIPATMIHEFMRLGLFWDEIIIRLENAHINEGHLPTGLRSEDCYTYRRLVQDATMGIADNNNEDGDESVASSSDFSQVSIQNSTDELWTDKLRDNLRKGGVDIGLLDSDEENQ